ncbi:MAG: hypothetical protein IPP82_00805 [Xanthomonadales bacterium]|nr:hypothetical protein [Xanthomonadales bacterium]
MMSPLSILLLEVSIAVLAPIVYLYARSRFLVTSSRTFLAVVVCLVCIGLESLAFQISSEIFNLNAVEMESLRLRLGLTLVASSFLVVVAGEFLLAWFARISRPHQAQ